MWFKHPTSNFSSRSQGRRNGKVLPLLLGKLLKFATGVFIGLVLTEAMLLPCDALAAEPPRQPVRVATWLDREACVASQDALRISPDVALGLVAFNSPYLFGGKALRSQLTCGACHAKDGPSGAAIRLRMRAPVPDLRVATARVDVAAFADHAVVAEFDGPPLPQRTAHALAALASVVAPLSSDPAKTCQVDATSLVSIGLRLTITRVLTAEAGDDELDFLIDSLRFILGEMVRETPPDIPASLLVETNRTLHDAMKAADNENRGLALIGLRHLADRWEAASARPHFEIAYSLAPSHE